MSLKLISDNERLQYKDSSGAKFFYRRINSHEYRTIEKVKTTRGLSDLDAIGLEVIERCLLGWENIVDDDDNPVAFSKDKIQYIPGTILNLLFIEMRSNSGLSEGAVIKNS